MFTPVPIRGLLRMRPAQSSARTVSLIMGYSLAFYAMLTCRKEVRSVTADWLISWYNTCVLATIIGIAPHTDLNRFFANVFICYFLDVALSKKHVNKIEMRLVPMCKWARCLYRSMVLLSVRCDKVLRASLYLKTTPVKKNRVTLGLGATWGAMPKRWVVLGQLAKGAPSPSAARLVRRFPLQVVRIQPVRVHEPLEACQCM